jgi:hypothetical protein
MNPHPRPKTSRMTQRAYVVLAALMLADGDWVDPLHLSSRLFTEMVWPEVILTSVRLIETYTGAEIEHGPKRRGYRLVSLPNDEFLERMLSCVPVVKWSEWWRRREATSRTRETRSRASSVPRSA